MATAIELPASIVKGGKFDHWVTAVNSALGGNYVICYSCLLKAAAGEYQPNSALGRWASRVSAVIDSLGRDEEARVDGSVLPALLRAAGGEIALTSPFGHWAARVSSHFAAL